MHHAAHVPMLYAPRRPRRPAHDALRHALSPAAGGECGPEFFALAPGEVRFAVIPT